MSRFEVEVKLRVDCDAVEDLIKRLSSKASLRGPVEERDVYFSHPCRDLSRTDEAVRVRYVDGRPCCLTYKGPRQVSTYKARLEVSVGVSDDPEPLLRSLGFTRYVEVVKTRTYVDLGDAEVTVDRVAGLGCFVEVESKGGDEEAVSRVLGELGLRGENVNETYAEMAVRKLKAEGRGPRST